MRKRLGVLLGTVAVVVICAFAPGTAGAYSGGVFTKAVATSDWTHGSFAGTVSWNDCNVNCRDWIAIAVVQPTLYSCSGTSWQDTADPNIEMIWSSGSQHGNITLPFEINGAPLIPGVYGQRVCLDGIQSFTDYPKEQPYQQLLATAILQVEAPQPVAAPPPAVSPVTPVPSGACVEGQAAVDRAWRRVAMARRALAQAKRKHRPTKLKREDWERAKKEAQQTERQQHELCG